MNQLMLLFGVLSFSMIVVGVSNPTPVLTINHAPTNLPKMIQGTEERRIWQVWNQNGTRCPDHTIPIRRNLISQTFDNNSIARRSLTRPRRDTRCRPILIRATLGIWNPVVAPGTGEFSLSQIWLVAGHYTGSDLNTIEAGWEVFPEHYHDTQPRLFVYWTRDTYQHTGCRNLECEGFVQVPRDFVIGAAFAPVSTYDGSQYDITMMIWKDIATDNWWLSIGQSLVGYWPAKLLTHLADGPATVVQWGGELVNTRSYDHTNGVGTLLRGRFWQGGFCPKHRDHRSPPLPPPTGRGSCATNAEPHMLQCHKVSQ
ncbi:unnamed protein product [Arabis nemorensis]|uniref:Neprosin PEP catalytic domain-containing protein n=1 Tax=Arabis nemorensis TaxID=586526 RepID=A0A565B6M7_9BRAS|nr:unnamed protein product [Arabis nemorensis]